MKKILNTVVVARYGKNGQKINPFIVIKGITPVEGELYGYIEALAHRNGAWEFRLPFGGTPEAPLTLDSIEQNWETIFAWISKNHISYLEVRDGKLVGLDENINQFEVPSF